MKILLIDQPVRNRGDESAHKALVRRLLAEDAGWTLAVPYRYSEEAMAPMKVHDPRVEYVHTPPDLFSYRCRLAGQRYGFPLAWWLDPAIRRLIGLYREADVVMVSPGGINLGGFQDWKHLFFLELARYLDKPLACFGRSLGPFPETSAKTREFKRRAMAILDYMQFVSIRDRRSDAYVPGAIPTLDAAFLETPEAPLPALPEGPYVVFVPNELSWHYAFREVEPARIRTFYREVARLVKERFQGHRIVFLPQLYAGTVPVEHDRDCFISLASGDDFVAPDTWNSDVQQTIIRRAACVVGARYHSVVFAVNNGVPVVPLSYEHKIAGLCQGLGLPFVDITDAFGPEQDRILSRVKELLSGVSASPEARSAAKQMAEEGFRAFCSYLRQEPRVSVVVPNYNHGRFLRERLDSVFSQTLAPAEVIVLDDASTDNSLEVLREYEGRIRLVVNPRNGGSPFPQWKKGLEMARGNLVWIAESDDAAAPDFLEQAVKPFREQRACTLSYVRSEVVDEKGNSQGVFPSQRGMDTAFNLSGRRFISRFLVPRNTVVNASAAVFSRKAGLWVENGYERFGGAGDILFWEGVASRGRVAFSPAVLNRFRVHGGNRTLEDAANGRGEEEALAVCRHLREEGHLSRFRYLKIRVYHYHKLRYGKRTAPEAVLKSWGGGAVPLLAALKKAWGKLRQIIFLKTR